MRPICVKCKCEMHPEKNEVAVEYIATLPPNKPHSYQLFFADLWKCPSCSVEIISGFGCAPFREYWQEGYREKLAKCKEEGIHFECFVR